MRNIFKKIKAHGLKKSFFIFHVRHLLKLKVLFFKAIYSDNNPIISNARIMQPTQFIGKGVIKLNGSSLGVFPSPGLFDRSGYIEARGENASFEINEGSFINNNFVIIVDNTSIKIGQRCLIGPNFFVTDSDFHGLEIENRTNGCYECKPVAIEDDVFIGEGVRVLKGVTIGAGSVVASGSLVVKDVEPDTLVAGVPARAVRKLR